MSDHLINEYIQVIQNVEAEKEEQQIFWCPILDKTVHEEDSLIATDKSGYPHNIFLISPKKAYVVGTH